ncbi:MAG: glycosyltransferase family 4 protein [Bryobacteraceae bacterium]
MKILFDHSSPFLLARGGVQVQIEETMRALERARVEVEFVRWWDERQGGDLIHYFGAIPNSYLTLAYQKKIPVVLTSFFSSTCNRPDSRLRFQGHMVRGLLALPGWNSIKAQLQWQAYREASHLIVGLEAERKVLQTVYGLPRSKISIVPLGLDEICLSAKQERRPGTHLITLGTICPVKRSIELAELARLAEVPILFVGDPYSTIDPYWERFKALVDDRFVFHQNHCDDRAAVMNLLSSARGFVLFSRFENWSLAAHEAAACGLPLLLPLQEWSLECFGDQAHYFGGKASSSHGKSLRSFYLNSPTLSSPNIKHHSWTNVAEKLQQLYRKLLD